MLFNTIEYVIFLLVAVVGYYIIPGKLRWLWLLGASVFFYYTLSPIYLLVLAALVLVNFVFAIIIEKFINYRNSLFIGSVLTNILVLVFFKYAKTAGTILTNKSVIDQEPILKWVILPIGLSYLVFTLLSYLIEVKRGNIGAEKHPGIFFSSLLFFPKVLQGPIERPQTILPQFHNYISLNFDSISSGLKLMLWGFFMKLVVADRIAIYVNAVYGDTDFHNGTSLALATVLYAFQIYADFSGYTYIARGSSKLFGIDLSENFKRPYFASSIKDFWDRWHISFSSWLRDYLFLPLAFKFSKKLKNKRYFFIASEKWIYLFASMITFGICGLWHGEGLNYLVWGLFFGLLLTLANWSGKSNRKIRKYLGIRKKSIFYHTYKVILTFFLVSFAWIFFRAENFSEAKLIITKIFTSPGTPFINATTLFYSTIGLSILIVKDFIDEFFNGKVLLFQNNRVIIRSLAYTSVIILILLLGVFDGGQFIYFQF